MKLSGKTTTIDISPAGRERSEVRATLQQRYTVDHNHIMIDSIHKLGKVQVVLFHVETSAYYHHRVAVIKHGRIESDIIADQED